MSYEDDEAQYQHSQQNQEDARECEAMRKMFVGGLNRETTEEAFFSYFGQFGNMVDKVIIKDPQSQQSRGFGFITYDHSDSVEAAFKARPHELDGKTLDVKRAMPREFNTVNAHSKTKRLFVGGFKGIELTTEELKEYLESRHPTDFGIIENVDFLKEKDGSNKGFGFIDVSDSDFADRLAISERSFSLKERNLSIKKAEPKNSGSAAGGGGAGGGGGGGGGPRGGGRGGARGGRGARGGIGGASGGRGRYGGGVGNTGGGGYGNGYNNSGYNQSGYGNYNSGYNQQSNYNQQSDGYSQAGYGETGGGYHQHNAYDNTYNQSGYGQSDSYNQSSSYGSGDYSNQSGSYNQSAGYNSGYGNQSGSGRGGRGASRGGANAGGNRYQPY